MKQMTETMREWLQTREARREADAPIAAMILAGQTAGDGPDYLDLTMVDNQPRITYILPEKAASLPEEERFTRRGARVIGRPGSVVQKVLGTKPDGHAMDRLTQSAGIFLNPPSPAHFELLAGEDVWKVFDQHNTCFCTAHNMIRSCMTGRGDQRKVRPGLALYERHAQIAVYTCGACGKYEARAIVWTHSVTGEQFYDRLYGTATATHALGALLAERQIRPLRNGYTTTNENVIVAFTPEEIAHFEARNVGWPALDTVHHLCQTCCTLSNATCPDATGMGVYWNYGERVAHGPQNPLISRLKEGVHDSSAGREEAP